MEGAAACVRSTLSTAAGGDNATVCTCSICRALGRYRIRPVGCNTARQVGWHLRGVAVACADDCSPRVCLKRGSSLTMATDLKPVMPCNRGVRVNIDITACSAQWISNQQEDTSRVLQQSPLPKSMTQSVDDWEGRFRSARFDADGECERWLHSTTAHCPLALSLRTCHRTHRRQRTQRE